MLTSSILLTRFNSRSRVGSDFLKAFISGNFSCFNSRSRVGSDVTNIKERPYG